MIDVQIHLTGQGSQACAFPSLPRSGDLVNINGELWRVDRVVLSGESVDLYLIRASSVITAELAAWGQTETAKQE